MKMSLYILDRYIDWRYTVSTERQGGHGHDKPDHHHPGEQQDQRKQPLQQRLCRPCQRWAGNGIRQKTWTFDEAVKDELMAELFTRYGYTGDDNPDMVDVEIDAYFFDDENRIVVGGLQVAYRYGRDTKVRLTEG